MTISVYGAGYVGLVSAVCFASLGHQVVCMDTDPKKIKLLSTGHSPIYEASLEEMLQTQLASGRLRFTTQLTEAVSHSALHLIAVGTPSLADGSADLSQVFALTEQLARTCDRAAVFITKSTVPVGTGDQLEACIQSVQKSQTNPPKIKVVSNPEFLREGSAIRDFLEAERIVLGGDLDAVARVQALYQPLVDRGIPLLSMSRLSAELTKYAANAFLATKISFINQMSQLAERVGADIDDIRQAMGLDTRIGAQFLLPGIGYGGSCFPKDVRALLHTSQAQGVDTQLLDAVESINQTQKQWAFNQLQACFQSELKDCTIGIWGVAFKPETDDIREASSLVLVNTLLKLGAKVRVYDPQALDNARALLGDSDAIDWCQSADKVLERGVDALVIATEWSEFKTYPLTRLVQLMGTKPVFDGRNCFALSEARRVGLQYCSIGRPKVTRK